MINIENLSKSILDKQLFTGIDLTINRGDRIGIIGQNGCGKSTLLNIVAGFDVADKGQVRFQNEMIKLVPQHIDVKDGETINDYLDLSQNTNAWRLLSELNLIDLPLDTSITQLSGGQKTKLVLIRAFCQNATALLLDEPTNHLDNETRAWLMEKVKEFNGIVVVVSHDREFLNTCVTHIFEMDRANNRYTLYRGNYDSYLTERSLWKQKTQDAHRLQQTKKRKMKLWLALKREQATAHPNPSLGIQIRHMEKRLQREILDVEIKKPKDGKAIARANFNGTTHNGKIMLRLKNVKKTFGDYELLTNASFEIRGSDHVRLIGTNGSGKSTLLKMIIGQEMQTSGSIEIGAGVNVGYFAQQLETLDPEKTVMENFLVTERRKFHSGQVRAILGAFLFSGEDINKKVGTLSYGERVRLQLAQMLNQENQLLLLDEPTNHLDIPSREVIEHALANYGGAVLIISHDEYFLRSIGVDWKLKVKNGVVS